MSEPDFPHMARALTDIAVAGWPGHLVADILDPEAITQTLYWHGDPPGELVAMGERMPHPVRIVAVPFSRAELEQETARLWENPDVRAVGPTAAFDGLVVDVAPEALPRTRITARVPVRVRPATGR